MNRKALLVVLALVVGGVGWYLFRPERLWVNQKVNETLPATTQTSMAAQAPSAEPVALTSGTFHTVGHTTTGTASIYQLADGKKVLRFSNFETSNGPDVQVYLVAADDAKDSETVKKAGFIHVGALKGNVGDQNYDLPEGVDLAKYRAVTVWCRRFGVNFGTAPLAPVHT
jgi:hypothetical protein